MTFRLRSAVSRREAVRTGLIAHLGGTSIEQAASDTSDPVGSLPMQKAEAQARMRLNSASGTDLTTNMIERQNQGV